MDTIISILEWFKGGTIGLAINGVDVKIGIGLDGKVTISGSGETDAVIDFVKGIIKNEKTQK